jgi:flagellar basal body-associated protein FliL
MSSSTPPAGEPAASRGRARLVLGACVLVLAGGGVVAQRTLARKDSAAASTRPVRRAEQAVIDPDVFVLNLPDAAGDRWFRLDVALVVDDAQLAERANAGLGAAKLRDRLLAVLARVRPATLAAPDAKETLRGELTAAARTLFAEPPFAAADGADAAPSKVLDVYFTEFLLQ